MSGMDLSQFSLLDLFRVEAETQAQVLTSGLLALERDHASADELEACMRAAHSLKGAARIVGLAAGVRLAHAMEDCFVAAQQGRLTLRRTQIDTLLGATDLLARIAHTAEADLARWDGEQKPDLDACVASLGGLLTAEDTPPQPVEGAAAAPPSMPQESPSAAAIEHDPAGVPRGRRASDRVLRVTAENLNRLLSLAAESLVESHWAKPFTESMLRLKRLHHNLGTTLEGVRGAAPGLDDPAQAAIAKAQRQIAECEQSLAQRLSELEIFDRRSISLAHRLYDEALAVRMRPFADGVEGLPRMVRDLAHSLGREVKLEIVGAETQVDRDILVQLDAPLGHLLRNAIDHGIETPDVRRAAGKSPEGIVRIEARHSAGALHINVSDDGRGVDMDKLRDAVVARHLTTRDASAALSDAELLEFLFLPGFTMKGTVTDVSGRGVGLDAVQDMVKQVRGTIRVSSQRGKGMRFQLQLPVTLSVVRTLLAEIAGEPYAFPLAYIVRALKLSKDSIAQLEGREHFELDGRQVGLVAARQVLAVDAPVFVGDDVPVIVMGDHDHTYGLIVDRFLGEHELVVHPLDAQLGKIRNIAAGALMEDGSPVLIVDADDIIRSMDKLVSGGHLDTAPRAPAGVNGKKRKRVLVVDDSLTVRELERKVIGNRGYDVEVAVDGMDGWNAVRTGQFNLVITDIDMPRMDGIELITLINKDENLKSVPVMIVSYKDREEDRRRGLEAGAAHYLTKGSFHDETLLQAVVDLIGEPDA
jgi:two-component system, chemotaxis family, sensor histidine kinase and response regulator WspE